MGCCVFTSENKCRRKQKWSNSRICYQYRLLLLKISVTDQSVQKIKSVNFNLKMNNIKNK